MGIWPPGCKCQPFHHDPAVTMAVCEVCERSSEEAEALARIEAHAEHCKDCGGYGVEMYVSYDNGVSERPCSSCQPYEAEVEKDDGLQTNAAPQFGVAPSDLTDQPRSVSGAGGEP